MPTTNEVVAWLNSSAKHPASTEEEREAFTRAAQLIRVTEVVGEAMKAAQTPEEEAWAIFRVAADYVARSAARTEYFSDVELGVLGAVVDILGVAIVGIEEDNPDLGGPPPADDEEEDDQP